MNISHAKAIARHWVAAEASRFPGFAGAFFHGSVNWLPDNATLPATSDLDIMVVLDDPNLPPKPGKFLYEDLLLEVSYLPRDAMCSAEQVLGNYHLAGSFHCPSVILDPSGDLTRLQAAVARNYAQRRWVERRCQDVRHKIRHGFPLDPAAPFPEQVIAWLFPTGVTTHLLLVAGLRNPTVRQRYPAVRQLLTDYDRRDVYETLLEMLGCAHMTPERAAHHLTALAATFDAAKTVLRSPFFFAADISDLARPVAIDGSRELITRGDHREAIFWMVATASRCQQVFHRDAPHLLGRFTPAYRALLADLGITSLADLQRRRTAVAQSLPALWQIAEAIIATNPDITDD